MRPRRTVLAAVAIVLALHALAQPSATRAADEVVWLPGAALAAIGFDLDGDGDHELVRLAPDDAAVYAEVWDVVDGGWRPIGDPVPVRPGTDEPSANRTVVGQLITWRRDGSDRVLVVTAHASAFGGPAENCCLAMAELALGPDGPVLDPIPLDSDGTASIVQPVDVEGDGTDELLLTTYVFDAAFSSRIDLASWRGSRLVGVRLPTPETTYVGTIGETDGVAGDDLIVSSRSGAFSRLSWRDGRLVDEQWPGSELAIPFALIRGDLLVQVEGQLQIVRWPRDEAPMTIASSAVGAFGTPMVAASGDEVAIVVAGADFGLQTASSIILGPNLERLGQVEIPETEPLWTLAVEYAPPDGSLFPYLGQFPVRRGETEVWQGGIVVTAGGPDGYRIREASPYAGILPLGVVGPDDGWIVAGSVGQHAPPGFPAFLFAPGEPSPGAIDLRLLPRMPAAGTAPAADAVDIALGDVIEVESGDGRRELLAGPGGFEVEISAPFGTAVVVIGDGDSEVLHLFGEPLRIAPDRLVLERDEPFSRTVVVVLPDGRFVLERWTGTFLAGDLEASAAAETVPFGFAATIAGETMPGAVISSPDGSTTADEDGRFSLRVDARAWPEDVAVSVEDPFGRTLELEVEVIGFVDYRGWPWMALIGALVLGAGVALYVRVPRMRADSEPPPPEAPSLEEIEV